MTDDLTNNGTIFIANVETGRVFYWLTLIEEPGPLIAEGCITGSESLMLAIEAADRVTLQFHEGPMFSVTTDGGTGGSRWVRLYVETAEARPLSKSGQ